MSIIRKEQLTNPLSASYAETASYALNASTSTVDTSSLVTTSSFNTFTASINIFTASYNTGSFSGSFIGTASWAESASQALTASYAFTASYVNPLNQNVILTGSIFMSGSSAITGVDYIDFDTTASNTGAVGRLKWNDNDGTLDLGLKGGNVTLQIGQEEVARVTNKTGIDLLEANYQAVRITGAQGTRIEVGLAKGDSDGNSIDTLGLVTETIINNESGFVTTKGLVRGIDTRGNLQGETWNEGDQLYLSPTTFGALTNIPPTAPSHSVRLGYVVQKSPNGSIFVKVDNGYEIDELHNVNINTASLSYGDLLMYDTQVWYNTKQLTGSYGLTGSLRITGSIVATSFTGSLSGTAATASYYLETDPIFVAKSASLATTGSNNFKGTQNISGSVNITGSLIINDGVNFVVRTDQRALLGNDGFTAVSWGDRILYQNQKRSIDWENRILYASNDTTPSLNWSSNLITTSPTFFTTTISDTSQEDFSSTANFAGTVIRGSIDVNVVLYDLVYLDTDGKWYQNNQSTTSSSKKLGIYLDNNLVLIEGHIVLDDNGASGPDIQTPQLGVPIFIRAGNGAYMSTTPPTLGYVRILGHIYYQNQNTDNNLSIMRFNPSNDYYLLG